MEDVGAVVEWLTERCSFKADAKSSLVVLHNRNDMTTLFRASNWASELKDHCLQRMPTRLSLPKPGSGSFDSLFPKAAAKGSFKKSVAIKDCHYCENHARKMRTFFTRRLEPKTRSSLPR